MPDQDIASLKLAIDASDADTATGKTKAFTDASKEAETQTGKLTVSAKAMASALRDAGGDLTKITATSLAHADATNQAARATDNLASAYGRHKAAASSVVDGENSVKNALNGTNEAMGKSRETTTAIVLVRELLRGNMSRLAGSLSIEAGLFGFLTVAVIEATAAVGLLLGPILVLEGAALKAQAANLALENAIAGVGRVSGVTLGQVAAATAAGAAAQNVSIGTAQEWAESYAKSGKIAGDVLIGLTSVTKSYAEATGTDTKKAVEDLASAFSDPTKGAETLQNQLGLLTGTQLTHIKNLQDEGNLMAAQTVLFDALNKAMDDSATVHLHGLALAWDEVKTAAENAWHSMVVAAGGGNLEENVAAAQAKVDSDRTTTGNPELNSLRALSLPSDLKALAEATDELNKYNDAQNKVHADAVANNQSATGVQLAQSMSVEANSVSDLTSRLAKLKDAQLSPSFYSESVEAQQNVNKQYDATSQTLDRVTKNYSLYNDQAGIDNEISKLQAESAGTTSKALKNQDTQQIYLLQHQGDLISNTELQTKATDAGNIVGAKANIQDAEKIKSAEAQLSAAQASLSLQNDLNKQVEAGTLTSAQATEKLNASAAAFRLEAIAAGTTGDTKKKLIEIAHELEAVDEASQIDKATAAIDKQNESLKNNIALLELQTTQVGKDPLASALAVANLKSDQFDADNPTASPASKATNRTLQAQQATDTVKLSQAQKDYNSQLTITGKLLDGIEKQSSKLADSLSNAFGNVGTAIGGAITAMTSYNTQLEKNAEEQTKIDAMVAGSTEQKNAQILLTQKQQDTDTNYYASLIDASSQFFGQNTAGYKILQAVEAGYRAFQLASSIAGIAQKATETASTVAADTTQTVANTATGASKIFAELGPWAFPVVAAMIALLSGLGGGSSAAAIAPVDDPAKDLQASNGAGTVLGDPAAKSASIANSLTQLAKDTNTDLEYSNQMVTSLKAIQNSIGSLTALLARQLAVGGLFNTSGLGLGTTGSGGTGLLSSLFGSSSTTTTLLDQGINIAATTIGAAVAGGINASSYQTVQSVKTSTGALFGLFGGGTKTSDSTTASDLGPQFTGQISSIIGGLRSTVLDAATKLGVVGAQQVIDSLSVNIGSISFKDMTGSEIQDTLNQVFGALGDQIAAAAVPVTTQLQQVGEGALETLARLLNEYTAVDDAAKTVGFAFTQTGVDSLAARDALVQASGGLDQFTSQANFFSQNFLTSSQQLAPIQKAVNDELTRLGVTGVTTKDQFALLVQSIDVTTSAGASLYAALQNVAPAFAKVADVTSDLNGKILDQQIALLNAQGDALDATALQRQKDIDAMDASLRPMQAVINATTDLNTAYAAQATTLTTTRDNLKAYSTSLLTGTGSQNSITQQYAIAKAVFEQTATAAKNGDPTALANIQQVSEDFLTASQSGAKSAAQYATDLARVKNVVSNSESIAQQQLDQLNASVIGLLNINQSVLSVADAIANLQAALTAQATYNQNQSDDASAASAALAAAQAQAAAAKVTADQAAANTATAAASVSSDAITYNPGDYPYGYQNAAGGVYLPGNISSSNGIYQHATGLNRVPYDNYRANLHEGESVLTKAQAGEWRNRGGNNNDALIAEIRAMRQDMKTTNDKVEKNTRDTYKLLRGFSPDGNSIKTAS